MEKVLLILTQATFVMWSGPAQRELVLLGHGALWWGMWMLASPETRAPCPAGQSGYTWPCGTAAPGCWNRSQEGWNAFFLLTWPHEWLHDVCSNSSYMSFCFCLLCSDEIELQMFVFQGEAIKNWGTAVQLGSWSNYSCWDAGRWLCRGNMSSKVLAAHTWIDRRG